MLEINNDACNGNRERPLSRQKMQALSLLNTPASYHILINFIR
jgi:hypothetical protein